MEFKDNDDICTHMHARLRILEDEEFNLHKHQYALDEHHEASIQEINSSINMYSQIEDECLRLNMPGLSAMHYEEKMTILKTILHQSEMLYNIRTAQIKSKIAANRDEQESIYENLKELNKSQI